ncbi:tetratricopeptide repeat protein [Pseudomonas sp. MYb3]|uniref:tetratricopeptide repeat protein n=1 Tax=unclassified Pseudomonas TaxID=196821 RepID=UPI0026B9846A
MIKHYTWLFFAYFALCGTANAELTPTQKSAKDTGIAIFQQSDWYDSQPFLNIAAEAGDRDAQYYLGEAIRLSQRYITPDAKKWYEASAEQGFLYAMLRLSNKNDLCGSMGTCTDKNGVDWRDRSLTTAQERAKKGDTEAMTVLYTAGQGLPWLEKAAEAGDSYAQQMLASAYKSGAGWFLIPGSREKAIIKWFKASSEGGNPRGMFLYANYLYDHNGSKEEIAYWVKKSAEHSHIDAVGTYAYKISDPSNELGYPENLIEAYGLTLLLSKLEAGTAPGDAKRLLPDLAKKMNPVEITEGIEFSKEWKKITPPYLILTQYTDTRR